MPRTAGRTLKDIFKDVSHRVQLTWLRSVNRSPVDLFSPPTRSKPVPKPGDVLSRPEVKAPLDRRSPSSDTTTAERRLKQLASHAAQGKPPRHPSARKIVFISNKRSPYPGLIKLLGDLIDGDTLPELVTIMAEPDEPEARALISVMQTRIERRLTDEGLSQDVAAQKSSKIVQGIAEAWSNLHQKRKRPVERKN
jgi:hypothetical protein